MNVIKKFLNKLNIFRQVQDLTDSFNDISEYQNDNEIAITELENRLDDFKVETTDLYIQIGKLEQRIQQLIELNNLKEKEEK